jgi:hypothetical protein
MNNHSHLVHKAMLEIGTKYPHVRIWKTHTGEAYTMASVQEAVGKLIKGEIHIKEFVSSLIRISFGQVGQTDLTGVMAPFGRAVFIEVKTGTGRLSKPQKAFRDQMIAMGAIHIELRKLEDLEVLNQCQRRMNV